MTDEITIRPAKPADLADINAIYNYYIAHSTCVWTTQPCSEAERQAWYEEHGQSMPVLVAESNRRIVGWGALGSFRAAYTAAGTLEDSIYVHHDFHRQKIGSRLLAALIAAAQRMGLRSLLANISADQAPSIRLHEKFGFQQVAHLRDVGQKFNQRFDAVYLQLLLAANPALAPTAAAPSASAALSPSPGFGVTGRRDK
ncbi:MAG TPA: GNAT family N-acetyltransferase [Candidatus Acidoferrum sp.]|nr:GNAT family N-acetyltransferase [Candidatus Acidoferrum sp.]